MSAKIDFKPFVAMDARGWVVTYELVKMGQVAGKKEEYFTNQSGAAAFLQKLKSREDVAGIEVAGPAGQLLRESGRA